MIMASASGQPCTLRIASFLGRPCASSETTVGCHLPVSGKGISTKVTDLAVAFGCMNCHEILDGSEARALAEQYPAAFHNRLLNALVETWTILAADEVIEIKDGRQEWLSSGPWR
jgi:hypothetical protein